MKSLHFIIIVTFCAVSCDALILEDKCTTPRSQEGLCLPLQECPSIFAISSDFETPMTLERLEFLIESQCGYVGNNPKVCCPVAELELLNE